MSLAKKLMMTMALSAMLASVAGAVVVKQERVPGGVLEQTWSPGFGVGRVFTPLVLPAGNPAIPTPSADNTVAVLQNVDINLGGIALSATDPSGYSDYTWEGSFFTGAGNTRVGLILRADPSGGFQSFYQFVINPGLFTIRFRKFVAGAPGVPDLASWPATVLPAGVPTVNSWHHMKVIANANQFRCFFDGTELTATPIVDATAPLLSGWVGAYNFSASVGEVPVYFDDLLLSIEGAVPVRNVSWGTVKKMFR